MAAILNFLFKNKSFKGELHIHRDIINGVLTMYRLKRKKRYPNKVPMTAVLEW